MFKVPRIRMRLLGRNLLSDAEQQVPHAVHRIGCPLVLRPAGVQDLGCRSNMFTHSSLLPQFETK